MGTEVTVELALPPVPDRARTARHTVAVWLQRAGSFSDEAVQRIRLAMTEVFANAVAAQRRVGCSDPITVRVRLQERRLSIATLDHGGGFEDPAVRTAGTLGVGLQLARAMVDDLQIEHREHGACVTLVVELGDGI